MAYILFVLFVLCKVKIFYKKTIICRHDVSASRNVQGNFFWFSLATWLHFFSRLKCKNRLALKKTVFLVLMFIPTKLPHWIHSRDSYLSCMLLYALRQHRTWAVSINNRKTQCITFTTFIFSFYNLKWICFNLYIYKKMIELCSNTEGWEGQWHPGLYQQ